MNKCIKCGSYAFNLYKEGIDQGGLCDVHYWQGRAHRAEALAQPEQTLKLMPREATPEMLKAMDECSIEGYDERLYAGHAGSVYMAAWDAFYGQHCYCGNITSLGVIHRDDGPCHYPEHTSEYKRGYADAMNWKVQNHLEHLPAAQPEQQNCKDGSCDCCWTQPQQEPLAYIRKDQLQQAAQSPMLCEVTPEPRQDRIGIYTTPPQRTWVGLTDEEFQLIYDMGRTPAGMMEMVEAKLKEKNNG